MADNIPGGEAASQSMASATKSFQGFASEVQRMAKDTADQTTRTMEKLRGAKSFEEVMSIQTSFLQQSFSSYADYTRRMSELMMTMPMELARQGRTAFQEGADSAGKAVEKAGEQFRHHQG